MNSLYQLKDNPEHIQLVSGNFRRAPRNAPCKEFVLALRPSTARIGLLDAVARTRRKTSSRSSHAVLDFTPQWRRPEDHHAVRHDRHVPLHFLGKFGSF